jgi:ATP-dependent helicase YprA (DUF1998 family)
MIALVCFLLTLLLLKTRFERIDGVVRQGLDTRQCLRIVRLAVCRARPSRAKRASAPHCNRKRISKGFEEERDRIREAKPDILLTNFMMLELLMTRQSTLDRAVIANAVGWIS